MVLISARIENTVWISIRFSKLMMLWETEAGLQEIWGFGCVSEAASGFSVTGQGMERLPVWHRLPYITQTGPRFWLSFLKSSFFLKLDKEHKFSLSQQKDLSLSPSKSKSVALSTIKRKWHMAIWSHYAVYPISLRSLWKYFKLESNQIVIYYLIIKILLHDISG